MICEDLCPRQMWQAEDLTIDGFIIKDGSAVDDFARSKSLGDIRARRHAAKGVHTIQTTGEAG